MYLKFCVLLVLVASSNASHFFNMDQLVKRTNLNLQSEFSSSNGQNNQYQTTKISSIQGKTFVGIVTKLGRQNSTTDWAVFASDIITLKDNALFQLMADKQEKVLIDQHKSFKIQYAKQLNQSNSFFTVCTDNDQQDQYVQTRNRGYHFDIRKYVTLVATTKNH